MLAETTLYIVHVPAQSEFAAQVRADVHAAGHLNAVLMLVDTLEESLAGLLGLPEQAATLLMCVSMEALANAAFRAAAYLAFFHRKRVIPLLLEPADLEDYEETRPLADLYPADFTEDYPTGLAEVQRALEQEAGSRFDQQRVYIAHDPADRGFVRRMAHALTEAGVQVWMDFGSLVAGQDWREARFTALKTAHAVLVVGSAVSTHDVWVQRDVLLARSLNKLLIPVISQVCMDTSGCVDALYTALEGTPVMHVLNDYGWFFPDDYLITGILEALRPADVPGTPHLHSGARIGAYEVGDLIGQGGMGEVYRGRHTSLGRAVAIKILPADMAHHEAYRLRFEREARTIAALRHPNIVQVYDFGVTKDLLYMAMEYIPGVDLNKYLMQVGVMSLAETVALLREVASALDYAHRMEMVHRDIKPQNIMLEPLMTAERPFRAVLTDFGMSKYLRGQTMQTGTDMVGTVDYIAPEQIMGSATVDHRADIYALGVVTFKMLTGRLPFLGKSTGQILLGHVQQPAPDPRTINPELPDTAAEAILRALAKSPDERYASAEAFVRDLGA